MGEIKRTYYSIREVSEMFSLPYGTLRFWEKEIKQLKPHTERQTRFYSEHDLEVIRRIIYLRSQNVPVADISHRLTLDSKGIDTRRAAYELLQDIRKELVELREML
ncbi:MAG: MerR family transcriptional regulator [Paludibacteraceae bacterium]|nr:MerR family transcriptional regulator [Paludibacteraceae bacterium]